MLNSAIRLLIRGRRHLALLDKLLGIKNEKVDLANDNLVRKWILCRNRVLLVVSRLEHLRARQVEYFKKDLYQVWPIEMMKVLLTKVSFVTCLQSSNNDILLYFHCIFYQTPK